MGVGGAETGRGVGGKVGGWESKKCRSDREKWRVGGKTGRNGRLVSVTCND